MRHGELGRVNILREFYDTDGHRDENGFMLVEHEERHGEPCIMDHEGTHIMDIPPLLLANVPHNRWADVLIPMVAEHRAELEHAMERGEQWGRRQLQRELRAALGVEETITAMTGAL